VKGLHTNSLLRSLRPTLERWVAINQRLGKEWAPDAPWWYNERAQLSLFAGAVWRTGGECFEEFSGEKRLRKSTTHRLNVLYSGRVDLYFRLGSIEYVGEAKNTWSGYTRNDGKATKRISDRLEGACRDAGQTKPVGMQRLGIVFVAPYFRASVKKRIDERLVQWIREIRDVDADARAWVFPMVSRYTLGDDGFYYPGVAVLLKTVKRRIH
jgi:hypothetical protein